MDYQYFFRYLYVFASGRSQWLYRQTDIKDKIVITEFMAENIADLMKKMSLPEFAMFKSLLNCLIFIHSKDSIEVFDKNALEKYFA